MPHPGCLNPANVKTLVFALSRVGIGSSCLLLILLLRFKEEIKVNHISYLQSWVRFLNNNHVIIKSPYVAKYRAQLVCSALYVWWSIGNLEWRYFCNCLWSGRDYHLGSPCPGVIDYWQQISIAVQNMLDGVCCFHFSYKITQDICWISVQLLLTLFPC